MKTRSEGGRVVTYYCVVNYVLLFLSYSFILFYIVSVASHHCIGVVFLSTASHCSALLVEQKAVAFYRLRCCAVHGLGLRVCGVVYGRLFFLFAII